MAPPPQPQPPPPHPLVRRPSAPAPASASASAGTPPPPHPQLPPGTIAAAAGTASAPAPSSPDFAAAASSFGSALFPPGPGLSAAALPSPGIPQSAALRGDDGVRELMARRIATVAYLKRTLLGKNVWLGTLRLTRRDVESIYEPERMRKRTQRALLLGLSLAPLLELASLPDFARAVLAVVAELDVMPDSATSGFSSLGGGGGKGAHGVRNFFKTGTVRKRGLTSASSLGPGVESAGADASGSVLGQSAGEGSWIVHAHVPFAPDFTQTFLTLLDIFSEVYHHLLSFTSQPSGGASGLPGASTPSGMGFPGNASAGFFAGHSEDGGSSATLPSGSLSAQNVDLITKVDAKLKKTLLQVSKEIDGLARHLSKAELDALDPLMRDAPAPDAPPAGYAGSIASGMSGSTLVGSTGEREWHGSATGKGAGSAGEFGEGKW